MRHIRFQKISRVFSCNYRFQAIEKKNAFYWALATIATERRNENINYELYIFNKRVQNSICTDRG